MTHDTANETPPECKCQEPSPAPKPSIFSLGPTLYGVGFVVIIVANPLDLWTMSQVLWGSVSEVYSEQSDNIFDNFPMLLDTLTRNLNERLAGRYFWLAGGLAIMFIALLSEITHLLERVVSGMNTLAGKAASVVIGLIWLNYSRQNALSDINYVLGVNPDYAAITLNVLTGVHFVIAPAYWILEFLNSIVGIATFWVVAIAVVVIFVRLGYLKYNKGESLRTWANAFFVMRVVMCILLLVASHVIYSNFRPRNNADASEILARFVVAVDFNDRHRCGGKLIDERVLFLEVDRVLYLESVEDGWPHFRAEKCTY